jgi:hypothetical protein
MFTELLPCSEQLLLLKYSVIMSQYLEYMHITGFIKYFNGFAQRVSRQRLGKHVPVITHYKESSVFHAMLSCAMPSCTALGVQRRGKNS